VDCRRGTWGYAPEGAFREVSDWIRACLSPGGGVPNYATVSDPLMAIGAQHRSVFACVTYHIAAVRQIDRRISDIYIAQYHVYISIALW